MTQEQRLLFLIRYLLSESEAYADIAIPPGTAARKALFRSLCNVRRPKEISDAFLQIQDAYLQHEIRAKGITDADTLPYIRDGISLWQGDITTLRCDAIVNAANAALLGCFVPCHACIDNAIHTFSGVQLRLACASMIQKQAAEEEIGRAKITAAYNLPCRFVLHTVGPIVHSTLTARHRRLLADCYRACLDLAEQNGIKSIAFPCISTGEFHFPNEQAAEIAVRTVQDALQNTTIERVIFNVFKDKDKAIYQRLLGSSRTAL